MSDDLRGLVFAVCSRCGERLGGLVDRNANRELCQACWHGLLSRRVPPPNAADNAPRGDGG